jgi:hypothetical protein
MVIMEMSEMNFIVEDKDTVEYKGEIFDRTHGSPFDRGAADSYYHRPLDPHWYPEGTYNGDRVEAKDMHGIQLRAYAMGYEFNERFGDKKDWN